MSTSISSDTHTSTRGCGGDSRFGCNICLESVVEPVVTLCGHLYCWPCLYRWLEPGLTSDELQTLRTQATLSYRPVDASRRTCPVCKAACSVATVVPIYVRSHQYQQQSQHQKSKAGTTATAETLTETKQQQQDDDQPSSPQQAGLRRRLRFRAVPNRPSYSPSTSSSLPSTSRPLPPPPAPSLSTGLALSLQQGLFGNSMLDTTTDDRFVSQQHQPRYDPATEFLSRVLLMLGSFVILCLLLF